jgi:hypothetical protein
MPGNDAGPPESEVPAPKGPAPTTATVDTANDSRSSRQSRYDALAGNARRFAAKRRTAPLPPCGCIRDPDYDRHVCGGEISDNMAEAAVAAVVLLDQLGTPGLLDERTCRAIWRIGQHRIATAVHRRSAGAA